MFIVDDVAFIHPEHGHALADEIKRRGIRKEYYLETRGDVLLRNKQVFERWRRLGLRYMFLGLEAVDEEGLKKFRKRVALSKNFEALECARSLGLHVAVNIIADPAWDEQRFEHHPRVGHVGARDRTRDRKHALSRHRDLAGRGGMVDHVAIIASSCAARGNSHSAAAGPVL